MAGYEIGISGLRAAQKALDVIGNNIANAATQGYHRQDIDLRPADSAYTNGQLIGQGVNFAGVVRRISELLDGQILSQDSTTSDFSKRLDILRSIESAFSELSTPGLSTAMDAFFSAFGELSLKPWDANLQSAVLTSAQTLSNQFRNVASVVGDLYESVDPC